MNDKKNISGLIHHLSRQLASFSNEKWTNIGYPDIRTTHISILLRIESVKVNHNIIAKQLGISRQGISKLKHELIENGYLTTNITEFNKKSEILLLSEKGQKLLVDFKKANKDLEKKFIEILGKENFKNFKSALLELDDFFKNDLRK